MNISGANARTVLTRLMWLLIAVGLATVYFNGPAGFILLFTAFVVLTARWYIPRVQLKGYHWTVALALGLVAPIAGLAFWLLPTRTIPQVQAIRTDRYREI